MKKQLMLIIVLVDGICYAKKKQVCSKRRLKPF